MNKFGAKSMIARLEKEDDKMKTSIYVSKRIFTQFKKACGKAAPSAVLEKMMEKFLIELEEEK